MRDYFSNLIDGSLGRTESVRPRQASLFAALPYVNGVVGVVPVEPVISDDREEVETTSPARNRRRPLPAHEPLQSLDLDTKPEARDAPRQQPRSYEPRPNLSPGVEKCQAVTPTVELGRPVQPESEIIAAERPSNLPLAAQATENRIETIRIVETSRYAVEPMPVRVHESLRAEQMPRERLPDDMPPAARVTETHPVAVLVPRPAPIILQPQVIGVSASARTAVPVAPPQRADTLTTIQVTIGRIEVRATSLSAPARPRQARPRQSLEDYLHQRSGGAK